MTDRDWEIWEAERDRDITHPHYEPRGGWGVAAVWILILAIGATFWAVLIYTVLVGW